MKTITADRFLFHFIFCNTYYVEKMKWLDSSGKERLETEIITLNT